MWAMNYWLLWQVSARKCCVTCGDQSNDKLYTLQWCHFMILSKLVQVVIPVQISARMLTIQNEVSWSFPQSLQASAMIVP
jgi:hypothetical protein